jgi:multiple antibiotic resistance protein
MEQWTEYTRLFTALLVIVDPFMAVPILLSLTPGYSEAERSRTVRVASFRWRVF